MPAVDISRISAAEAALPGVLKLSWNDGYKGIVDVRGIITEDDLFAALRNPELFWKVRVAEFGHSIYWGDEGDEDADFGCHRLREIAEQQAAARGR